MPDPADGPTPTPPARIGHYEVLGELGRGGMGVVYRARDLELGRIVALKRPLAADADDPDRSRRFRREARAAARLSHPNVVPIFEVFEQDGTPWIAMEFVDGVPLRDHLSEHGPLAVGEVIRHGEALASALQAAHEHHVLHRDVNPNNVFIGADGRALLMDFGLARFWVAPEDESTATTQSGEVTGAGRIVGTPGYMSPEQLLGRQVDPRSDLFSLGAVLYEMCTGVQAFPGSKQGDVIDAILHREVTAIGRLNYEVPDELERIIRKALAKRPDERYQTSREMLTDLRTLRRHSGSVSDVDVARRTGRTYRRVVNWGLAAVALAAVAVAATLLIRRQGAERSAQPPSVDSRPVIAILPLEDRAAGARGDLQGAMVADLLAAQLSESRAFRGLNDERVEEVLSGLGEDRPMTETLSAFRDATNARWLVSGQIYREGNSYLATLDVFATDGTELGSFQVEAATSSALVNRALPKIHGVLAPSSAPEIMELLPVDEDVRRLVFQGRIAVRQGDYSRALGSLRKAAELEPRLAGAHVLLAQALDAAGHLTEAQEVIDRARRLVDSGLALASTRDLQEIRATDAQLRQDFSSEAAERQVLVDRFPDEPELHLALAAALSRDNRPAEALSAAERAVALDPRSPQAQMKRADILADLRRWQEADLALEEAARFVEELDLDAGRAQVEAHHGHLLFRQESYRDAAVRWGAAAELYRRAGLDLLAASAEKSQGDMALRLGDLAGARARYDEVIPRARGGGNRRLVVTTLASLGGAYLHQGRMQDAEDTLRQAVDEARSLNNTRLLLAPLANLASCLVYSKRLGEGIGLAQEAFGLARHRNDRRYEAKALEVLATAHYQQGQLAQATDEFAELVALHEGDPDSEAVLSGSLSYLAYLHELRGDLSEASVGQGRVVALERERARTVNLAYALVDRARIRGQLALWAEAEQDLSEAEALAAEGAGLEDLRPRIPLVRGTLRLLRGQWSAAEAAFHRARGTPIADQAVSIAVPALIGLSEVRRQMGDAREAEALARSAVDHPVALAHERTLARLALAQALAAGGNAAAAASEGRRAFDEASAMGLAVPTAQAAALLDRLPPAFRPSDSDLLARAGRAELRRFFSRVPPDRADAVQARADLETLSSDLEPAADAAGTGGS